jgi:hypothetical protein
MLNSKGKCNATRLGILVVNAIVVVVAVFIVAPLGFRLGKRVRGPHEVPVMPKIWSLSCLSVTN